MWLWDVVQKNCDVLDPNNQLKRSDYGLPDDKFLFACFNQLYKMDPDIFTMWYVTSGPRLSYKASYDVDDDYWTKHVLVYSASLFSIVRSIWKFEIAGAVWKKC